MQMNSLQVDPGALADTMVMHAFVKSKYNLESMLFSGESEESECYIVESENDPNEVHMSNNDFCFIPDDFIETRNVRHHMTCRYIQFCME